jgi:hypothetical protein
VSDVDHSRSQLARATGTSFGPISTVQVPVQLHDERHPRLVTLHSAVSLRSGVVLEVVHAAPRIGPWAVTGLLPMLSYSVPEIHDRALTDTLRAAGLLRIATTPDFAFWGGDGGITIRLTRSSLVSPSGGNHPQQNAVDLGPVGSFTLSPCAPNRVRAQLSHALGVDWASPITFSYPWIWADQSLTLLDATVEATQVGPTYLTIETPHQAPPLPKYLSTVDRTPAHLAFLVDDLLAADQQLADAGMQLIGRVANLISYYEGADGILVQVVSSSFGGGSAEDAAREPAGRR